MTNIEDIFKRFPAGKLMTCYQCGMTQWSLDTITISSRHSEYPVIEIEQCAHCNQYTAYDPETKTHFRVDYSLQANMERIYMMEKIRIVRSINQKSEERALALFNEATKLASTIAHNGDFVIQSAGRLVQIIDELQFLLLEEATKESD